MQLLLFILSIAFSFYVWEIMHGTIKKMNKQVMKLQKEVEEMKDRLEAAELKVSRTHSPEENLI